MGKFFLRLKFYSIFVDRTPTILLIKTDSLFWYIMDLKPNIVAYILQFLYKVGLIIYIFHFDLIKFSHYLIHPS
ncbi:hypothetical protein Htur_5238 (plasmid) [Haloterrigena turkmenica DSM 5511]|uniref:Uncharacterized protein n=1 Tax=Haloterrigena turkmenica (strain ATCC 51198 / DSM 5511 / JCM 9101 / NCIMB 13204 / VKM B-1734 / 4k) TaxID=543526 RepID=D2S3C2_HALTV|nr:hypothetical protein Htur_5238 [Haloterrigena turkmenica DSM 5511]